MDFKSKGLDQEISAIASLTSAVSSVELDIQNSTNTVATTFICGMFSDTGSYFRPTIQFLAGSSVISHSYLAYPDGATSYNNSNGTTSPINFTSNLAYTSSGTYNVQFTGWIHKGATFTGGNQKLTHTNIRSLYNASDATMKSTHFQAASVNSAAIITGLRFTGGSYGNFTYVLRSYAVIIED